MLQERPGRSGKQEQEQNSPNLGPTSYPSPACHQSQSHLSELAELPGDVEDLDEGEGHGDEAEHEVGDCEVDDEDVARRPHEGVARHHVDHHQVPHRAHDDHERVQADEHVAAGRLDAGLRMERGTELVSGVSGSARGAHPMKKKCQWGRNSIQSRKLI